MKICLLRLSRIIHINILSIIPRWIILIFLLACILFLRVRRRTTMLQMMLSPLRPHTLLCSRALNSLCTRSNSSARRFRSKSCVWHDKHNCTDLSSGAWAILRHFEHLTKGSPFSSNRTPRVYRCWPRSDRRSHSMQNRLCASECPGVFFPFVILELKNSLRRSLVHPTQAKSPIPGVSIDRSSSCVGGGLKL